MTATPSVVNPDQYCGFPTVLKTGEYLAVANAAQTVFTFTTPAVGATTNNIWVGICGYVYINSVTTCTLQLTVSYTDENNTARSAFALPLARDDATGAATTSAGFTPVASAFYHAPLCLLHTRNNNTLSVQTSGTYTTVNYDVGAMALWFGY